MRFRGGSGLSIEAHREIANSGQAVGSAQSGATQGRHTGRHKGTATAARLAASSVARPAASGKRADNAQYHSQVKFQNHSP